MKRTKEYWRSKYVLEGITLGEFWQYLRPKGAMHMTMLHPNAADVDLGPVTRCDRTRSSNNSEFKELWLKKKSKHWIRSRLEQNIKISGKSILFKPIIWDGVNYTIRLEFESDLPFNM